MATEAKRLTDDEVRERIKKYLRYSDGCDLRSAMALSRQAKGLLESLGVDPKGIYDEISAEQLELAGIKVKQVNPKWVFEGD